jgi:hypothetical protein
VNTWIDAGLSAITVDGRGAWTEGEQHECRHSTDSEEEQIPSSMTSGRIVNPQGFK